MSIQQQDAYLQKNYNLLNEERYKIEKFKKDFETLNSAAENSQLVVTSNYYSYIVLLLITLLLIFLLVKFSLTGQQRGGGNNFKNERKFGKCVLYVFKNSKRVLYSCELLGKK